MWPLNLLKRRHWFFLGACVLFLLSYFGFIGWGKVGQALEHLADQPSVRERFATPIGRGEAIVTSFMFFLLTPLAIAAALGIMAFLGAIGAGILRALLPLRDVPGLRLPDCRVCGRYSRDLARSRVLDGAGLGVHRPHRQGHPDRDRPGLIGFGGPPALYC